MAIFVLVVGVVLFIGLVLVHEFGHFIVSRRNGVEVEEFGLFFPPRLFKRKTKAGWLFTINALPLGGFVKLKGEHDSDTDPGSFGHASLWVKSRIMAAGVVMNLLAALVLLTLLAWMGMPQQIPNQYKVKSDSQLVTRKVIISDVEPGSPAAKAGLKPLDELTDISIPGYSPVGITDADKLKGITKDFAGKTATITYVRDGHFRTTQATLLSTQTVTASQAAYNKKIKNTKLDCATVALPKGYLGISPSNLTVERSTWSAPVVALGMTAQATALTFEGLGHALAGLGSAAAGLVTGNTTARQNGQCNASSQVSGPVGIFVILKDGSLLGYQYMLFIIALISLTLAIMNILPIPALDGGRLWMILISRGLKRPLSPGREEAINAAGFIVLIGLIILVTVVDVQRFF